MIAVAIATTVARAATVTTARRVATAHNATMELNAGEFPEKVGAALGRISKILEKHRTVPRSAE